MAEFTKHDGKGIPVSGNALVLVRFRNGEDEERSGMRPSYASFWTAGDNWTFDEQPHDYDIVEYCVVSPC